MSADPTLPSDTVGAFVPHGRRSRPPRNRGPLDGLTFAVKDLFDVAGCGTGGGNPEWLEAHARAPHDAAAVAALLDAGARLVGKTVCDEFFYSLTGVNVHYGTPVNVRAPGRLPAGSSSGSAAAVAAQLCDFALGSDTGGSVRIPAAFCGLYGLRPTHGRVDLTGGMAMAPRFDTAGWFARDAELFRTLGNTLLIGDSRSARVDRVLLAEDAFAQADPAVAATLTQRLHRQVALVPVAGKIQLAPADGFDGRVEAFRIVQAYQVWEQFGAFVEAQRPKLGPGIKERMAFAATVDAAAYRASLARCDRDRDALTAAIPPGTVVAMPTAPCIAPLLSASDDELLAFRSRAMALTCHAGVGGLPQVTVPAGEVDGCPVGLSFLGWGGGDEALLDWAVAFDCPDGPGSTSSASAP